VARSSDTIHLKSVRAARWSLVGMPGQSGEELLWLVIQAAGVGIFETDLKRQRTRFSQELCELLGLPSGTEMATEEAWQVVHDRDRSRMLATANAAIDAADQGRWSGVYRVRRTDDTIRWVSIHGRRVYRVVAGALEPIRAVGAVIDITRLKEKEKALRKSERRLRESGRRLRFALDAAQIGTFEADMTASEAIIDAQEANLLGLPEDTRIVSSDELRKRVPLEDWSAGDVKKERLIEQREAFHHEFRLGMPDGSVRWLTGHADVRGDRIFGVNFDVTRQKLAEIRLRENEERLRMATSGAELGVFEWDVEADAAIWESDGMCAIFGRTRGQAPLTRRQFIGSYLHPDDAPEFNSALKAAREPGGRLRTAVRIRRADGKQRWLQIDARFQGDRSPRLLGVVADVTERKQLEQRTKALADQLVTVQEHERQRIAQELHDSTAQHLVALNLNLMRLRPNTDLSGSVATLWDETESLLERATTELRTFSYLMHPPTLEGAGLCSALQQYVDGFSHRSGFDIDLHLISALDQLPYHLQRTLLRIVQEALGNVYRHATSVSRASIGFRLVGHRLHLVVADNGRKTKTHAGAGAVAFTPGRGLAGIAARVQQYDGQLRIRTGKVGTRVHIAISLDMHSVEHDRMSPLSQMAAIHNRTKRTTKEIESLLLEIRKGLATQHKLRSQF
jgi:PAS domain S-box-containing protein